MKGFNRPIPGQSLTAPPGEALYERPPQINTPKEALMKHIDRLNQPKAMRDVAYFLEKGLTLVALVEGMLRSAVISGIHTVDMSLIIAPTLHEYIAGILDEAGIEYDEGFEDDDDTDGMEYEREREAALSVLNQLRESGYIDEEDVPQLSEKPEEDFPNLMSDVLSEGGENVSPEEGEATEEGAKPQGLMARI